MQMGGFSFLLMPPAGSRAENVLFQTQGSFPQQGLWKSRLSAGVGLGTHCSLAKRLPEGYP